jgi:hypothetical protein
MLRSILISCALLALMGCQPSGPEQTLATIDGKPNAAKDYATLLDEVAPKCLEDRAKIADLTSASVNQLKQKGKSINHLEMLSGLRDSLKEQTGKQDCKNLYILVGMAIKGSK